MTKRTLAEVITILLKHKDSLSSELPLWVLKMNEGEEEQANTLSGAISEIFLIKRTEEGPTRIYENVDEFQTERWNYTLRVRTIIELELARRKGRFRYRPVRLFSYEEPSITALSEDDSPTEMTIDEILQEKRLEKDRP